MIVKILMIISVGCSLFLWTLKLFTTEVYNPDDPSVALVLRAIPALKNTDLEDNVGPRIYLDGNCNDYSGQDLYRWLVGYGYLCSTASSVLLLALSSRKQMGPTPASKDRPT